MLGENPSRVGGLLTQRSLSRAVLDELALEAP